MGREVRRVPAKWEHPRDEQGHFRPMFDASYEERAKEFLERANRDGLQEAVDWMGCPERDDYMPTWPDSERTHLQMYETCSEGTPISPVFATPEELARWLADNGASAFGRMTATYEEWMVIARGKSSVGSMVIVGGREMSGVEAASSEGFKE